MKTQTLSFNSAIQNRSANAAEITDQETPSSELVGTSKPDKKGTNIGFRQLSQVRYTVCPEKTCPCLRICHRFKKDRTTTKKAGKS